MLDLLLASSGRRSSAGVLLGLLLRASYVPSLCWRLHLSEAEFQLGKD
jgi:hypothetical protein